LREVLDILDEESNIDFILVNERIGFRLLFSSIDEINEMNDVLIDFRQRSPKPLIVVSSHGLSDGQQILVEKRLSDAQIPVYSSFERAAGAIAKVLEYSVKSSRKNI